MYKQHQLVLVATDSTTKKGDLCLDNTGKVLMVSLTDNHPYKQQHLYILSEENIEAGDWIIRGNGSYGPRKVIEVRGNKILCSDNWNNKDCESEFDIDECKKTIASTDKSLVIDNGFNADSINWQQLPQIPQSFIEYFITEFNKGNRINKVNVEYEEVLPSNGNYMELVEVLKINQTNEINIKPIKEFWSREEVEKLLHILAHDVSINNWNSYEPVEKWIQRNL